MRKPPGKIFWLRALAIPMGEGVRPVSCNGIYTAEYVKKTDMENIKVTWNPIFMVLPLKLVKKKN